ncbi:MAG: lysozyme inhibitor LprI family protein [Rhizomicrobium sp.]|nr:lysozyme inhibitor LprI family protein [Rhizomicrobium sp.]
MKLALFFVAALLTAPAMAQDCKNAMSQSEMNICADQDYQKADKALNTAYSKLLTALDDAGFKAKLRATQRSWISYRDNECIFETADNEGGSIHPMVYAGCLTRITKERTKAIEALTACQKNAETCG